MTDDQIQVRLEEAVRAYAARVAELAETGEALEPLPPGSALTQSDVAVTAAALLRAVEVTTFELAAIFGV